jgi:hypothetical protein
MLVTGRTTDNMDALSERLEYPILRSDISISCEIDHVS